MCCKLHFDLRSFQSHHVKVSIKKAMFTRLYIIISMSICAMSLRILLLNHKCTETSFNYNIGGLTSASISGLYESTYHQIQSRICGVLFHNSDHSTNFLRGITILYAKSLIVSKSDENLIDYKTHCEQIQYYLLSM